MKKQIFSTPRVIAAIVATLAIGYLGKPMLAQDDSETHKAKIGLAAAPVPLNLDGKDKNCVGLGSYLVNVSSECNGCHSNGPATQYVAGGNPFLGQKPAKANPATYLAGGRDFGALIPGSASIISRNLTPDKRACPRD